MLRVFNGESVSMSRLPAMASGDFFKAVTGRVSNNQRISAFFGANGPDGETQVYAVLGDDRDGNLDILRTSLSGPYPSLTPDCPEAHMFERELYEKWGIVPSGHPWLKPVRFQPPLGGKRTAVSTIGQTDFFHLGGEGTHEVAVGPVHEIGRAHV